MIQKIGNSLYRLRLSSRLSYKYVKDLIKFPFQIYTNRMLYADILNTINFLSFKAIPVKESENVVYIGKEEDIGA